MFQESFIKLFTPPARRLVRENAPPPHLHTPIHHLPPRPPPLPPARGREGAGGPKDTHPRPGGGGGGRGAPGPGGAGAGRRPPDTPQTGGKKILEIFLISFSKIFPPAGDS